MNRNVKLLEEPMPNNAFDHSMCVDEADTETGEISDSDENEDEGTSASNYRLGKPRCRKPRSRKPCYRKPRSRKPRCPKPSCPSLRSRKRRRPKPCCLQPCCPKPPRAKFCCPKPCRPKPRTRKPHCPKPSCQNLPGAELDSASSSEEYSAESEAGCSSRRCRPTTYKRARCFKATRQFHEAEPPDHQIYSGYFNFLRDFRQANGDSNYEDMAINAAKAWSSLTQAEKKVFQLPYTFG